MLKFTQEQIEKKTVCVLLQFIFGNSPVSPMTKEEYAFRIGRAREIMVGDGIIPERVAQELLEDEYCGQILFRFFGQWIYPAPGGYESDDSDNQKFYKDCRSRFKSEKDLFEFIIKFLAKIDSERLDVAKKEKYKIYAIFKGTIPPERLGCGF